MEPCMQCNLLDMGPISIGSALTMSENRQQMMALVPSGPVYQISCIGEETLLEGLTSWWPDSMMNQYGTFHGLIWTIEHNA
jgi:hypothetical protein